MGGVTSRVQLVSNALLLLGDKPIASLTENSTGALLGANLFRNTYLSMLQDHRWRFASRVQQLSRITGKPNTGFAHAYRLPAKLLYVYKADGGRYAIYENELHSNSPTVTIEYIEEVVEDTIPAYFAKALEYNLAAQFALPLTGDLNKADFYKRVFVDEVRKAKAIDSTQYTEVPVQSEPYVTERY